MVMTKAYSFASISILAHSSLVDGFAPRCGKNSWSPGGFASRVKPTTFDSPKAKLTVRHRNHPKYHYDYGLLLVSSTSDNIEIDGTEEETLLLANSFLESIMKEYEAINSTRGKGMSVLRNVSDLESGKLGDIVLRNTTEPFWQACINKVDTPIRTCRVCALGTPGIGKTAATPILIRMLLKANRTVVYLPRREIAADGWFFEFTPSKTTDEIAAMVYQETTTKSKIPSLRDPSTYFVVDPGATMNNCCPGVNFKPKFILVSSPDECHWGESDFTKNRRGVKGSFKYFPLWSLDELLTARPILGPTFTVDAIKQRFRQVGGVPGHVFDDDDYDEILAIQEEAINRLTERQVLQIAKGELSAVHFKGEDQPKSAVIGYKVSESDNGSFTRAEVVVIASLVKATIATKHIKIFWSLMQDPRYKDWEYFEQYTRDLMSNGKSACYEYRACGGKIGPEFPTMTLGGCKKEMEVVNIVEAAKNTSNILFHSLKQAYVLIDFIYQDSEGVFHAFQATTGMVHTADPKKIKTLMNDVGVGNKLIMYYIVPGENFVKFRTKPLKPSNNATICDVWIVSIPDPNFSGSLQVSIPTEEAAMKTAKEAKKTVAKTITKSPRPRK